MPANQTNTQNTVANDNESAVEQAKAKKRTESTVSRAIRVFVEERMSAADGQEFFNKITKNGGYDEAELRRMFSETIDRYEEFMEQDDHLREALANVTTRQIRNVAIGMGAGFESKRSALVGIFDAKYDFSASERDAIVKYIEKNLSLSALTDTVRSEAKRMKLLARIFPSMSQKDIETKRRDRMNELDKIFEGKNLTDAQKAAATGLLNRMSVTPDDLRPIMELFPSLEEKQLLIKAFLPRISLSDLEDAEVLTHAQVQKSIRDSLTDGHGRLHEWVQGLSDVEIDEIARTIDPNEVMIETNLFPKEVVDAILGSVGMKYIADEINETNIELQKEYAKMEDSMPLQSDAEGKYLPNFQKELKKLGFADAANFQVGSYISGQMKNKDGEEVAFVYRIDVLEDDPARNTKLYDGSPRIGLTQILLPDGTWRKHAPKGTIADTGYGKIKDFLVAARDPEGKNPLRIIDEAMSKQLATSDEIREAIPESIETLESLNNAINALDPAGRAHTLKEEGGVCLAIGTPGSPDYNVFRISNINERKKTIAVNGGSGPDEIFAFSEFVEGFRGYGDKCKRIGTLDGGMASVFALLGNTLKKPDAIKKLSVEHGKIMMQDRKDDHDFPGVTEFIGSNGLIRIENIDDPKKITFSHFEKYRKSGDKEEYGKGYTYTTGYNTLYQLLHEGASEPKVPDENPDGPEKAHVHAHETRGWFKSYLGNYSIHDMMKGLTDTVEFFKHHLHHGASLNAARFQLALWKKMKWLGVDEGILSEMRSKVHTDARKLMNETVEQLKGMPGPDRQEEILHILGNKWSHDYEIHAAMLTMLQKNGTLYAGKLQKHRGAFLFFERVSGQKYSPNLEIVQKCKKTCAENGEPFTEERLLQDYLKQRGGSPYYEVDGNLWLEVKKGWVAGITDESATGEKEAYKFVPLAGRTGYVMDKFKSGEFAHGLGGLKAILDKGGPSHDMHLPGIVLALSNIPQCLEKEQVKTVRNMFLGGRPYTAFAFIDTPSGQATFRNVIKKLCAGNASMKKAYEKIEHLQHHDPEAKLVGEVIDFWKVYGEELNAKLYVTRDAEIFQKKDSDPDFSAYFNTCAGMFGGVKKTEQEEFNNDAYDHSHSSFFAFNPEHYLRQFVRINPAQSILAKENDETRVFWDNAIKSIDAVRTMSLSGTPEQIRETKLNLYARYHRAFMGYFNDGRFRDDAYETLKRQDFIKKLEQNQGIRLTPYGTDFLSSPAYNHYIEEDFNAFMWGGRNTKSTQVKVLDNMDTVLKKPSNDNTGLRAAA